MEFSRQSLVVAEVPGQGTVLARGVPTTQPMFCHLQRRGEMHDPKGNLKALFVALQVLGPGDHSCDDRCPRS
ncbi:MAG: hypothetical protein ACTML1_06540, partial [Cellulosimicrobium funkei]